jgi:hypothetical protein
LISKENTYSDVSMPSVIPSAGADTSANVPNASTSSPTVVVFVISSVVTIVSVADGVTSFVDPFSVVSALVDGITTVDSVTFVICVTVVPLTASELALCLLESCLKLA